MGYASVKFDGCPNRKETALSGKHTPERGKVVVVGSIPDCVFCQDGTPGPYDFATRMGPWANGCEAHWQAYRVGPLGTGSGQLWITADQADVPASDERDLLARALMGEDIGGDFDGDILDLL